VAHVIALDQGTTSSRAIVFDEAARPVAAAQREFEQRFPGPGLVEHDPVEIWSSQLAVMAEAIERAGLSGTDIKAVGLTNQRETTLVWDRATGNPVHHAIVWQDRRTAGACDRVRADGHEPTFRDKTGLVLDAYFSGTKLAWILDNIPGVRARAERGELAFGTVDSWLVWKLTRGAKHITDPSNASRTLLYNIHTLGWDDGLLSILGIPRALLPEVVDSSGVAGAVAPGYPAAGAPIAGIAGDQQAALFGQLCTGPGMAKSTYGTGCFLLMHTGAEPRASDNRLLTTVAWRRAGERPEYALEGAVFVGGAVIQWLRDGLGIIDTAPQVSDLASTVTDSGGVLLVPAFVGLGAPHWDQYARGTILGITRGTTGAHLCRAALDAIAFSVADLLGAMQRDAGGSVRELRVDGGAAASDPLLQIQADLLQVPVVRPQSLETTAAGAAYLAGLGAGVYPSLDALPHLRTEQRRFEPSIPASEARSRLDRWGEAVERSKGWEPAG
jgi:glycerol kinase